MERILLQLLETRTEPRLDRDDAEAAARILANALQAASASAGEDGRESDEARCADTLVFVQFVLARLQPGSVADQLQHLDLAGLRLACACISGDERAHRQFEREYGETIRQAVAKLGLDAARVDEVHQRVRLKLLGPPRRKLAAYSGRGALRSWVRAVALREGLSHRRRAPAPHDTISQLDDAIDPELGYLKQVYRAAFREALREALLGLDDGERLVLRLRVKDELTLEQVAAALGVHRATAARRLAGARESIWKRTKQELSRRLEIDPREFESVLRLVRSRLDLSLSGVL